MTTAGTAEVSLDRYLQFDEHAFDYHIKSGPSAWDDFTRRAMQLEAPSFALVVSQGVPQKFVDRMTACLRAAATRHAVTVITVPDGEDTKTLAEVERMAPMVFNGGFRRQSVIVTFGGGKAANMAGVLAGLTLRGVRLVHVPTTWLSLWDGAGASLKQAVNLFDDGRAVGKNLLGLFWPPEFVFGITDVLASLPANQIRSAIGEVIKSVFAINPEQIPVLGGLLRPAADYTAAELVQIAEICLDAKQQVMLHDSHEKDDALACEWGHTGGHVIELLWHRPHGIAILIGCLIATRVAVKLGYLDPAVEPLLEEMVRRNGVEPMLPPGPSDDEILAVLRRDNKSYLDEKPGHIDMVLLDAPGQLHRTDGTPITQVPEDIVLEAFRSRISVTGHTA